MNYTQTCISGSSEHVAHVWTERSNCCFVVAVYHVTIVAIGHGLKLWLQAVFYALHGVPIFETLCRPAYFVRTSQLSPHPGHEQWQVLPIMSFNVMTPSTTVFFISRMACRGSLLQDARCCSLFKHIRLVKRICLHLQQALNLIFSP